jgi:hypothetical protein
MIVFTEPFYNWLQQITNHYLTYCHLLPTGHSTGTSLTFKELSIESESESESESYVITYGQSASLPWNKAPIWDLRPHFYCCQTIAGC